MSAVSGTPQETVERALSLTKADGCVVIAEAGSSANLRFAGNTLTTNGVARSFRLTVISIAGDKVGVVSRSGLLDAARLADVVAEADQAARDASPAEDAWPLITPADAASGDGWPEPAHSTGISVFRGLAPALGEAFDRAGRRRLYGFAEHTMTSTFLGTSTGLRLRHDQPDGRLELNAKGGGPGAQGGGKSTADVSSAWAGAHTVDFGDVDVERLTADLFTRLEWGKRRVDLPAGRYETLLPPTAMADLMIYLCWSAGARDAQDGQSVFAARGGGTRVGERLAELPLRLWSDPAHPAIACSPFVVAHASSRDSSVFDNGLALGPTDWISAGRLESLLQTRHSAELTGLPVTPAIDNLLMESDGATASLEEMVAATERGLLLTCLWYIREVDPQSLLLTGLTRDGVYLVENGEVTAEVNNFRFNESPVDLLSRISEAGAGTHVLPREWNDYFSRTVMPPVRVPDFNMSTVSKAS